MAPVKKTLLMKMKVVLIREKKMMSGVSEMGIYRDLELVPKV